MRGALSKGIPDPSELGIIPADAGSTVLIPANIPADKDHPRGCGEHSARRKCETLTEGSSPRMRGALEDHHPVVGSRGIIPADAGSTCFAPCSAIV